MSESEKKIVRALEDIKRGRMVIVTDDAKRENEGDLVMAAELVTPEAINFMITEGRGLVCLALTAGRARALKLPLMVKNNTAVFGTQFTVSIDAATGVTTGISAFDRARTITVALDSQSIPQDLHRPGHVFPLIAARGGVLERPGHTEAAVDLARLAGCEPAGVLCEVLDTTGHSAGRDYLQHFAQRHHLTTMSIADMISYRQIED